MAANLEWHDLGLKKVQKSQKNPSDTLALKTTSYREMGMVSLRNRQSKVNRTIVFPKLVLSQAV